VVCRREGRYELIDGFKRLGAARSLGQIEVLSVQLMETDERPAKAVIYGLNRAGGRTRELGEAWIIHALVREIGMSQVEVAELFGAAQKLGMPPPGAARTPRTESAR
jgi:hypothetical protein